jgi:glucokinase
MIRVLAVDLGGTKTATALVDQGGAVTNKQKKLADRSLDAAVAYIADRAAAFRADAAGIIVPGIYDSRKGTAWTPNLWGWDEVPLRDALRARLDIPVSIASDRAGYVLGEQWLGVARGCDNVIFVAVGTGIGVGIVAGGRLLEGAHGIAGAAGWMAVDRAWKDEYAQTGCWETEAAGPAVARRAALDSAETVVRRARQGDPGAADALRETASYLAIGVANLISLLDPDMVVLGGGLMQAGALLLDPIRAETPRWAQPVAVKKCRIELTALGEDAGLLGAARLALLVHS